MAEEQETVEEAEEIENDENHTNYSVHISVYEQEGEPDDPFIAVTRKKWGNKINKDTGMLDFVSSETNHFRVEEIMDLLERLGGALE